MTEPEPGRPTSLSRRTDLVDAEAVLDVVKASRSMLHREQPRTGPVRLVREAIWFFWEHPRLPRRLIDNKYPLPYPWSAEAHNVYMRHDGRRPPGGWGLVIKHLYPRELLVRDLVQGRRLGPNGVVALLKQRLMAAVVTAGEDRLLPSRGQSPQEWSKYEADPWLRYRSAPIGLDGFAPVPDPGTL